MNIKYGIDVKTNADLQNLITSVILRQTGNFTDESIYSEVSEKLIDSVFKNNPNVEKRCRDTIETLFNIGSIKVVNDGTYQLSMSWPSINKR